MSLPAFPNNEPVLPLPLPAAIPQSSSWQLRVFSWEIDPENNNFSYLNRSESECNKRTREGRENSEYDFYIVLRS